MGTSLFLGLICASTGSVDIIPAKHKLRLVAQVVAGRVTVNSLMRIVAATYSLFQGRDDDVNVTVLTDEHLKQDLFSSVYGLHISINH